MNSNKLKALTRLFCQVICTATLALLLLSLLPVHLATAATNTVATPFKTYYAQHEGMRILGQPISQMVSTNGYFAQYFEKGRLEDHRGEVKDPTWAFMYGRLTAELIAQNSKAFVNSTNLTYHDLNNLADSAKRQAPPSGFIQGVLRLGDQVFIPFDSQLRAAPGYYVPLYFWNYMTKPGLFPGGWLHDIGLPMTPATMATTYKAGSQRSIVMQAFERKVLTYDPLNPTNWQVELGNIGTDSLNALQSAETMIFPMAYSKQTLPLHIFARLGAPGEQISVILHWQDNTELSNVYTLMNGEDGRGLLIDSINWKNEGMPPQPPTQPATLELFNAKGELLLQQPLTMLQIGYSDTQLVKAYMLGGEKYYALYRYIPKTEQVGTAALNELLWGPTPPNLAGFTTALPSPQEVLNFPGRKPDWGPRVTLRNLTVNNGVATANFSEELWAYGGGSLKAKQIRDQITLTLKQFPSVQQVRIEIEGQTVGVLEP